MASPDYDVAIVSDLRYPGGNSVSIVEEVKAQAAAGYRTALIHVPAEHMEGRRTLHHRIVHLLSAGLADLVPARQSVRARALVIRQPRVFAEELPFVPRVEAEVRLLVVNQPPFDGAHPPERPYYDVAAVRERVDAAFGPTTWAPIGPQARAALAEAGIDLPLRADDWHNIVNLQEWVVDRSRYRDERLVIGRHSRGHPTKWPATVADILAAYPDDPEIRVRILGGADPALRLLGRRPGNWEILPFGSVNPARFLDEIDVFVYFHHPAWTEAFGRNIIEAMASGAPAVLPSSFARLFGDAALYAEPAEAPDVARALRADPARYRERVEAGRRLVEARFGPTTHVQRLAELIGEPARAGTPAASGWRTSSRILLVAPEPRGAGATTRLLRLAGCLPEDIEPTLLTAADAFGALAAGADLLCEHVRQSDAPAPEAGERLRERVARTVVREDVSAVVVDADRFSPVLAEAVRDPEVPLVWLRRSTHHSADEVAAGPRQLAVGDSCRGDASALLPPATSTDTPSPDALRDRLGVDRHGLLALLALGADERNVIAPHLVLAAEALLRAGCAVVVPEFLVSDDVVRLAQEVARLPLQPLSAHLSSFDLAVVDPGYTLAQEVIATALPALALPSRRDGRTVARAQAAQAAGLMLALPSFDPAQLDERIEELLRPETRSGLAARCLAASPRDATPDVAAALAGLVRGEPGALAAAYAAVVPS